MRLITLLAVCIAAVAARPETFVPSQSIVGGSVTTINQRPSVANILAGSINIFRHWCGGAIVSTRSVLSAAHCVRTRSHNLSSNDVRLRLGSTWANSGGVIHNVAFNILHPSYNMDTLENNIMIFRSRTDFVFSPVIRLAGLPVPSYDLRDNESVWVTGWGRQSYQGPASEQLRTVQVFTINQDICAQRYGGNIITANVLCTDVRKVAGRDACQGNSGDPVFHNTAVVGITSFGGQCALASYPGVHARVTGFFAWIWAHS